MTHFDLDRFWVWAETVVSGTQAAAEDCSQLPVPPEGDQMAVLIAKYLLTNGGFLRLAYHRRNVPSGSCIIEWLVT